FKPAVDFTYDYRYMMGVSNTRFDPDIVVNRAMLASVLYRISGSRTVYKSSSFKDNVKGEWYFDGVEYCYRTGIVFGYGNGKFGPEHPLLREDMMAMFFRFAVKMKYSTADVSDEPLKSYEDRNKVSSHAVKAVNWGLANSIISGISYTRISPLTGATRAQLAQVLMNFAEQIQGADVSKYRKTAANPYGMAVQNLRYYQDDLTFHLIGLDQTGQVELLVQYLVDGKEYASERINIFAYKRDYYYIGDASCFSKTGDLNMGRKLPAKLQISVLEQGEVVFRMKASIGLIFQKPSDKTPLYFKGERNLDCRILLYHEFSVSPPTQNNYSVISTPERFEENIKEILAAGYKILPLEALLEYEKGHRALPEKSVILTLDDGYESNYTMIYPILQQYGVPATIFMTVSTVDDPNKLTWDQLREMDQSELVDIQSHSWTHNDHTLMSESLLRQEVVSSFAELEKELGKRTYRLFAYPYGRSSAETIKTVKEYDIKMQFTTRWSALDMNALEFDCLPRFTISYNSVISEILSY
ncbi:MAG: polysaccharide deacetylase family protein, partial [Clostridia bacterium]|nr:polysaccharide deacetylase family protein [Clostridia bacterium]